MIKASDLFKADIYNNVSFELSEGVLAVLSKKSERSSVLLDTIARVKTADGGELSGNESAAYLSKGCPLPRDITASEYLDFILKVKKRDTPPEKIFALTEEISGKVISSLSALERLTLGVAASLIGDPDVIVIEEPYYGLSYEEYGDLKELLSSVSEEVPIVFSTLSVYECKEISDKIVVLSAGSQVYFGDTKALFETDINETDICCLIKGDKETIIEALERYSPEVTETVRAEIYSVTVKSVPMFRAAETRARIKKLLTKARLSLLEIRSEKEALLNIIGELTENDKKKQREYEESIPREITKITSSLVAFSHDDDGDEDVEDDEDSEELENIENEDGENVVLYLVPKIIL